MALNIPMPDLPGTSFLKGVDSGSNMFAKLMNARYNASLHPSGDVANALYVEQMKNQYGEDDPRYIEAKKAHEMALSARQSLMDYRTQLSNLAPYRAATPEEKLVAAQQGRGVLQKFKGGKSSRQGNSENEPIEPGMVSGEDGHTISEQEAQVYNQALGKKTTDAAIRNKIPYAENVKITMDSINPESLVQYSGPQGTAKYANDMLKAAFGKAPPEFMEYQKSLSSAKTLSKQLRQFWGDSIQASATDKIDQLTNPAHWTKNPEVALQQFNQLKQITDQELKTFQNAGRSPMKLNFDKKTDSFVVDAPATQSTGSDGDNYLMDQAFQELQSINPAYTPENIKHTAKERGISVEQVINQLWAKSKRGGG